MKKIFRTEKKVLNDFQNENPSQYYSNYKKLYKRYKKNFEYNYTYLFRGNSGIRHVDYIGIKN